MGIIPYAVQIIAEKIYRQGYNLKERLESSLFRVRAASDTAYNKLFLLINRKLTVELLEKQAFIWDLIAIRLKLDSLLHDMEKNRDLYRSTRGIEKQLDLLKGKYEKEISSEIMRSSYEELIVNGIDVDLFYRMLPFRHVRDISHYGAFLSFLAANRDVNDESQIQYPYWYYPVL